MLVAKMLLLFNFRVSVQLGFKGIKSPPLGWQELHLKLLEEVMAG
jgi:hypothetical protein